MAEYPIIMTAESVKGIMSPDPELLKTQTRQVITYKRNQIVRNCSECGHGIEGLKTVALPPGATVDGGSIIWMGKAQFHFISADRTTGYTIDCPYGQIGDALWAKETFAFESKFDPYMPSMIPEGTPVFYRADTEKDWTRQSNGKIIGRWRPPMFMPRWASRLNLVTEGIFVQHIQDISEADAKAEGIKHRGHIDTVMHADEPQEAYTYKYHYEKLWDAINAKRGYPWKNNYWVWALQFIMMSKKITENQNG